MRPSRDQIGFLTGSGSGHLHLLVADVIAVSVRQQYGVYVAEARIVSSRRGLARVVEESHAGRILEECRAIAVAQLAGVRTQRRDFDVLRVGRRGAPKQ